MAAAGNEVPHFLLHCLGGSFDGKCSPAGAGTEMQASLWGNLPVELLHNIVTKLPPSSLARFRAVAKQWRDLLSTPEAKKLLRTALPVCALEYRPTAPDEWYPPLPWKANAETPPSLLAASAGKDPAVIRLDLSYLPRAFHKCRHRDVFVDDGLVCFRAYKYRSGGAVWKFCVVNPMTRKYQVLPRRRTRRPESERETMQVRLCNMAEETSPLELSFRAFVASYPGGVGEASVFSSVTGIWKRLWKQAHEDHPEFVDSPWPQYLVSSKRAVVGYGADSVFFTYEEGVAKGEEIHPNYPQYDDYIDRAVAMVEVQNQLYCVEQLEVYEYEGMLEDLEEEEEEEEELSVTIRRLGDADDLWHRECRMPLTIGGRYLKVEVAVRHPRLLVYEYGVAQAAMVKNAICLAIGVKKRPGIGEPRPPHWPRNYEYSNVVLYHPESKSWELVAEDVPPPRFSEYHKLFEPTF